MYDVSCFLFVIYQLKYLFPFYSPEGKFLSIICTIGFGSRLEYPRLRLDCCRVRLQLKAQVQDQHIQDQYFREMFGIKIKIKMSPKMCIIKKRFHAS